LIPKEKWKFIAWNSIEGAYLDNDSGKDVSDYKIVFITRENKVMKVGISNLDANEAELMTIVEKYSNIQRFGFLQNV
jgi:uncharacterized membrane protein